MDDGDSTPAGPQTAGGPLNASSRMKGHKLRFVTSLSHLVDELLPLPGVHP